MTKSLIKESGSRLKNVPFKTDPSTAKYVREVAVRVEYDAESDLVEIRLVASLRYAEVMLETARVQLQELEEEYRTETAIEKLSDTQPPPSSSYRDEDLDTFETLWKDSQTRF